jgi:hypothetical protein
MMLGKSLFSILWKVAVVSKDNDIASARKSVQEFGFNVVPTPYLIVNGENFTVSYSREIQHQRLQQDY